MKISMMTVAAALALALATPVGPVAAMGSTSDTAVTSKANPDYAAAETLIKAKDYKGAIPLLEKVVAAEPKNADAYTYIGYAQRNLGEKDKALASYGKALEINPDHRGANEYLGRLYLIMDQLPKAEERLAKLDKLCTFGCEEYSELKKAVADYKAGKKPTT